MDPELRAYLDAMRQETAAARMAAEAASQKAEDARLMSAEAREVAAEARAVAAETRQIAEDTRRLAAETRQRADDARERADDARQAVEEARREARVMHEATMQAIGTLAEGLVGLREHIDRRFDEYHVDLMNRHVGPLEAAVRSSADHLADHERRIAALERRAGTAG